MGEEDGSTMTENESLSSKLEELITQLKNLRRKVLESASVDLMLVALKGVLTNFMPKFSPWRFEPYLDRTRIMPVTPHTDMKLDYVHRRLQHYLGTETLAVLKEFPTLSRPDVDAIKTILASYTQQSQGAYIRRYRSLTGNLCVDTNCFPIELVFRGMVGFTEEYTSEQVMYIIDDANYPASWPLRVRITGQRYDYNDGAHIIQLVLCDEASYYSPSADVWVRSEGLYVKTECTEDFTFNYARSLFFCSTGYKWVFIFTPEWSLEARLPA